MKRPDKLQHGIDVVPAMWRKINDIIDYLPTLEVKGDGSTTSVDVGIAGRVVKSLPQKNISSAFKQASKTVYPWNIYDFEEDGEKYVGFYEGYVFFNGMLLHPEEEYYGNLWIKFTISGYDKVKTLYVEDFPYPAPDYGQLHSIYLPKLYLYNIRNLGESKSFIIEPEYVNSDTGNYINVKFGPDETWPTTSKERYIVPMGGVKNITYNEGELKSWKTWNYDIHIPQILCVGTVDYAEGVELK